MKKLLFPIFFISLILTSCTQHIQNSEDIPQKLPTQYQKIIDMLQNLTNYKAFANVSYISNKGINNYITTQIATIDGKYFIEVTDPQNVAGNVTVFDGTYIYQFNENLNKKVNLGTYDTIERTSILFTNFINSYISSGVSNATESNGRTTLTINQTPINSYVYTINLTIDENLTPISLITKDINGNERIVVTYTNFFYNISVDEGIFSPFFGDNNY